MWVLEALLMVPGLALMETSHAYECADSLKLWGHTLVTDTDLFVDVWTALVATTLVAFYLVECASSSAKQTDYLVCRLVSISTTIIARVFVAYDASVACAYTPIFVHVITLIPLRCMEHFSDKL